jgi:hypothetical protein
MAGRPVLVAGPASQIRPARTMMAPRPALAPAPAPCAAWWGPGMVWTDGVDKSLHVGYICPNKADLRIACCLGTAISAVVCCSIARQR